MRPRLASGSDQNIPNIPMITSKHENFYLRYNTYHVPQQKKFFDHLTGHVVDRYCRRLSLEQKI